MEFDKKHEKTVVTVILLYVTKSRLLDVTQGYLSQLIISFLLVAVLYLILVVSLLAIPVGLDN